MAIDTATAGFIEAILAEPDADDLRLIYADWLDEHDEPDRAEFIRSAIQWVNCKHPGYFSGQCEQCGPASRLFNRIRTLLSFCWFEWAGPAADLVPDGALYTDHLTFRRGFIEYVRCAGDDWVQHADAILACHPVREVTLTTWPGLMQFCLESPEGDEMRIGLPGRPFRDDVPPSTNPMPFLLRAEWPRIRFHLPESP